MYRMSINTHSPLWKEFLKYLAFFAIGCFVALWFRGCSGNTPQPQIAKVIIPEATGTFEAKKPVHEPIVNLSNSTHLKNSTIKENLQVEKLIAENEKLKVDFAKANDSIKKLKYKDAVQLHNFNSKFEDDNLVLNINGIVQGEVKEVTPDYTIKEKKMEVPVKVKETAFRLLAGVEVGSTKTLDDLSFKGSVLFQNRKGNIISAGYDTDNKIWLGYYRSIF